MEPAQKAIDDIFQRNLEILKPRFPHVIPSVYQNKSNDPFAALIPGNDGCRQPIICIRRANSPFCPLYNAADIERLLHKIGTTEPPEPYDMVFILGMGLGEAGTEAVRLYQKKPRIVIIEPYPSVFRLAMQTRELGGLLNYERLHLYVGHHIEVRQILADCRRILPVGRTLLFMYPYPQRLIGEKHKQIQGDLIDQIRSARDIWHTTRRFGRQMLTNAMANLPSLIGGTPLSMLRNRFKGHPIICVAAGPSLQSALPLLKSVQNTLILACDSAVGTLLQAGIQPHIVATADIHPSNIDKLKPHMDRLRQTVLAFGLEADPQSIRTFAGQRRVGMTAYNRLVLDWLDRPLGLQCRIPIMTSVTHLAVLVSIAMGADPIILVGVDLAYLNGKSHAHGSVYSHIPENEKLIPVKSVDGGVVFAPPQLITDRLVLEQIIAGHNVQIVSVGMKGALIHGAQVKSLQALIDDDLAGKSDAQQVLDSIPWAQSPPETIVRAELHQVISRLKALEKECHRQHQRISMALTQQNQAARVSISAAQLKKDHVSFHRQNSDLIACFEDAMLNELQAIIKNEERLAATPVYPEAKALTAMLKGFGGYCVALINIIGRVVEELERAASTPSSPWPDKNRLV